MDADREKVICGLEKCLHCECDNCLEENASHYPWGCIVFSEFVDKAIALLKEQETVEHALDILRKNRWKEEDKCEKCPLLMAVSDGVHDMAKQFRKEG